MKGQTQHGLTSVLIGVLIGSIAAIVSIWSKLG